MRKLMLLLLLAMITQFTFADVRLLPKKLNINEEYFDKITKAQSYFQDKVTNNLYYFNAKENETVNITVTVEREKDYFIPGVRIFKPNLIQSYDAHNYLEKKDIVEINGEGDFIFKKNKKFLDFITPDAEATENEIKVEITFKAPKTGQYMLMIFSSCELKKDSKRCSKNLFKTLDGFFGTYKVQVSI